MPYGEWKDNYLDSNDMGIFKKIRKKYNTYFDTWDFYDRDKEKTSGCWAGNRPFVTPLGDILPCPFINISFGNINNESLESIYKKMFQIKYFAEYSPVCLAAQNKLFRTKFLDKLNQSMFEAGKYNLIFTEGDYCNGQL